ncbi:FRIGIDA-like protein 3 [Cynara cardunculus var. scolymus]|uniref:FRIGIDA-like protein 3 n=1 Tax=Cynara cardunculus var. scolymus TaxID=59895 RepID=UPI000D62CB9E|nr:FRIGIDA-like protein 3 [Cynara cardunculus var. scolymus]
MDDTQSVALLLASTNSKIQQLQKAFAELESHRAVTLNLKWKEIEDHFHGLEKSLKRRFTVLEDQEKEFETKTVQSQQVLEKRQAAVFTKEEASLVKLQEKRDSAVTAIAYTLGKHRNGNIDQDCASFVEEKQSMPECTINSMQKLTENDVEKLSNPQLVQLCKKMDSGGLHKFISDNRKNLASIKSEIPIALKAAADPGGLVLDSLNGFYIDGKKDSNLLGLQRTCIMLMECLSLLLTNLDANTVCKLISDDVKARAKVIAEDWKSKLNDLDVDASNGNSLEAHAFLQLVATFGIDSDFVQNDLSMLIPMVSRRRQTADLCRFLGLSKNMPDVIDVLVNSGRHIDAVNLAFAFELTEQFAPVSLLKSYLIEAKRHCSPTTQNDASEKELSALKAVIKCIEDHKLEDQYPSDPLQKRILQLEKAKADKKRATEVSKPQLKRPRANGVAGYGPRNTNIAADKNFYPRMTNRYAPPTQSMYDTRPYGYPAAAENHIPLFIGGVTCGGAVPEGGVYPFLGGVTYNMGPNHGNYFGNGYQYQAPYIHQVCRHGT